MSNEVDFSRTAGDYATHRAGFPKELFRRLGGYGIGEPGQAIVDLGTGTGSLGRGFSRRGARVTGVDLAASLIEKAREADAQEGLSTAYVLAPAEETGLPSASFDVVSAGQCFHWFDRGKAAAEARRLLKPRGLLCIAHFDWIGLPGDLVDATEALIEEHSPAQPKPHLRFAGGSGIYAPWLRDVALAGFSEIETMSFDLTVPYSPEGWRGRIRASQGVGAMLSEPSVKAFDDALAELLKTHFPGETLSIPHRVFALIATAPAA